MQYGELIETIQRHINNSETDEILRLITPENVDTIFKCSNKPGNTGLNQQLTDHEWFAGQYNQLVQDIEAETAAQDVEQYFTPENVLISQFGKDYAQAAAEAETLAADLGAPSPGTEADAIMQDRMEAEKVNSNEEVEPC